MSLAKGLADVSGPARTILFAQSVPALVAFYRDRLGFTLAYPASDHWAEFAVGGTGLCLHDGLPEGAPSTKRVSVGWPVTDLDAATEALRGAGIDVSGPNPVTEGLRAVEFADPEGNALFFEGA